MSSLSGATICSLLKIEYDKILQFRFSYPVTAKAKIVTILKEAREERRKRCEIIARQFPFFIAIFMYIE